MTKRCLIVDVIFRKSLLKAKRKIRSYQLTIKREKLSLFLSKRDGYRRIAGNRSRLKECMYVMLVETLRSLKTVMEKIRTIPTIFQACRMGKLARIGPEIEIAISSLTI